MAEEIINNQEIQPEAQVDEQPKTEPQDENIIQGEGEPASPQEGTTTPPTDNTKPTQEELTAKLKEYELKEEERKAIAQRLGVDNVNQDMLGLSNMELTLDNQLNNNLLSLCNEYGVSADPKSMQESLNKLKEEQPAKYYEFSNRVQNIGNAYQAKRNEIAYANFSYGVSQYAKENSQLLEAVPAYKQIVSDYCMANQGDPNIYNNLNAIQEMAVGLLRAGMEIGQAYNSQQMAKNDTSAVSGGIATAQNPVYASEKIWTAEEIGKMSIEEYMKNEAAIDKAYREGRVRN